MTDNTPRAGAVTEADLEGVLNEYLSGCYTPDGKLPGMILTSEAKDMAIECMRRVAMPINGIPDGWMIVPIEPTDNMYLAALVITRGDRYGPADDCIGGAVYRAMILASPQLPTTKRALLTKEKW